MLYTVPVPVTACLACRMLKDEGRYQQVPVRLVPGEVGNAVPVRHAAHQAVLS